MASKISVTAMFFQLCQNPGRSTIAAYAYKHGVNPGKILQSGQRPSLPRRSLAQPTPAPSVLKPRNPQQTVKRRAYRVTAHDCRKDTGVDYPQTVHAIHLQERIHDTTVF